MRKQDEKKLVPAGMNFLGKIEEILRLQKLN